MNSRAQKFLDGLMGRTAKVGDTYSEDNWDRGWESMVPGSTLGNHRNIDSVTGKQIMMSPMDNDIGDSRLFDDGSSFKSKRLGFDKKYTLTHIGMATQNLPYAAAGEPACACSVKDLASGDHPKECTWYRWKKGKR